MYVSPVNRPETPPGGRLQPRDIEVLRRVAKFRTLTAEHLCHLIFPGVSTRFATARLRLLWATGLLERLWLPERFRGFIVRSRRPIYTLGRRGAEVLADEDGHEFDSLWRSVRVDEASPGTVRHNLIALDLLVAIEVACRSRCDINVASVEPEQQLRARLGQLAGPGVGNRFPAVIPDGAFSLQFPDGRPPATFLIEVVRAGARSGNRTIEEKLHRYVQFNREGFFARTYGHERVRAVLFVTTSPERVEHLRALARGLQHGRNLFWFTSYERKADLGMTIHPDSVLGPLWTTASGEPAQLAPSTPA